MQTNFFSTLSKIDIKGNLLISINQDKPGYYRLLISVQNTGTEADTTAKQIIPLTLRGTVEDFDKGFFEMIFTPVQETAGLISNIEAYNAQLKVASEKLKTAQTKTTGQKPEPKPDAKPDPAEVLEKEYQAEMKIVEGLRSDSKFRQAYAKLPDPKKYPLHEKDIASLRDDLSNAFDQLSLFSSLNQ